MKKLLQSLDTTRQAVLIMFAVYGLVLTGLAFIPVITREIEILEGLSVLKSLTSLWLPVLTCFATFYFSSSHVDDRLESQGTQGRLLPTVVFLGMYLLISLIVVLIILFMPGGEVDKNGNDASGGLVALVSEAATYILVTSPVLLSPVAWMTGQPLVRQ